MSISDIKKRSKNILSNKWGQVIGGLILVRVLASIFSNVLGTFIIPNWFASALLDPTASISVIEEAFDNITFKSILFITIYSFLISVFKVLLDVGYEWAILDLVDKKNFYIMDIFQTFNLKAVKIVGAAIMVSIFTALWSILFIIPGIIKAYSYSQVFNILKDDPDLGVFDAIKLSREMMANKKSDLFLLHLSFLAWYFIPFILATVLIFSGVSAGGSNSDLFFIFPVMVSFILILYLTGISIYLIPYIKVAEKVFYRNLLILLNKEINQEASEYVPLAQEVEGQHEDTEYIEEYEGNHNQEDE